jgi:NAD(P)-dependent dehydrogenase (short-subunit alcohol dehydrogenase family)
MFDIDRRLEEMDKKDIAVRIMSLSAPNVYLWNGGTSHLEAYSYAASKAAILHLTRMMAKYLAKNHIAVNAIAPGYFPSRMTDAIPGEESEVIEEIHRCGVGGVRKIWRAWRCILPRAPVVSSADRPWWLMADWRRRDELKNLSCAKVLPSVRTSKRSVC